MQLIGNKDTAFFPEPVLDPHGVPSFAIMHRPTARVRLRFGDKELIMPPGGHPKRESIWLSYVPVEAVLADLANLTAMGVAMLDAERPSCVLYRTPLPILEPQTDYERFPQ